MSQERGARKPQQKSPVSKETIAAEINVHKVEIDRSCFKKTEKEYSDLKTERVTYRTLKRMKDRMFLHDRQTIIDQIMSSKTPKFGNFTVLIESL